MPVIDFDFVDTAVRNGSIESAFSELLKGVAPTGKNLSKLGFDPNSVDPDDGNTLMHVNTIPTTPLKYHPNYSFYIYRQTACSTGNLESAIYLRKVGSDVNRFNDVGYTPLCCCILKAKSMGMTNGKDVVTLYCGLSMTSDFKCVCV
jgi:hypothetical protein